MPHLFIMNATEIKNLSRDVDSFTLAYIEAALWSSTGPAYGECPCCGKTALLDKLPEPEYQQDRMCAGPECGTRETPHEPPLDSNYGWTDIAPECLQRMLDDCAKFQAANDLTGYPLKEAGHDFWLTRAGHGCGFWENDFGTEEQCDKLTAACKRLGEFNLYPGDDGRLHGQ